MCTGEKLFILYFSKDFVQREISKWEILQINNYKLYLNAFTPNEISQFPLTYENWVTSQGIYSFACSIQSWTFRAKKVFTRAKR